MKYKYCGLYNKREEKEETTNIYLKLIQQDGSGPALCVVNEHDEILDEILFIDEDGINPCRLNVVLADAINVPLDERGRVKVFRWD